MPTTDSRQGPGLLHIGDVATGLDVQAQAAVVKLTPTVNSEDGTPTLETPEPAPLTTIAWALNLDAIQDWEDPTGVVNYLMDHALAEEPFSWTPKDQAAPSYSGTVQIVPIEVGGDVGVQVVTSVELPIIGQPTRDDTAPAAASSRSKDKAA